MLAHEKLHVYGKALDFAAEAAVLASNWDKKHAVGDHFVRASESVVLNLADAARLQLARGRFTIIDYAIGSSLEGAACLDVATIKQLLDKGAANEHKRRLCEIVKMLIGLRKAWTEMMVREESTPYKTNSVESAEPLFYHEKLQVYQGALELIEWFEHRLAWRELPPRLFRQVDESTTSIVLNIAEGNGRYAVLDHQRFLEMAQSAAVKSAAYLDLLVCKKIVSEADIGGGKEIVRRIVAMLRAM